MYFEQLLKRLHMQTLAQAEDREGALVKYIKAKNII